MGLLTLIQIPCHHVLSNEIPLNFKYHTGIKEFSNINWGIGIIKKLLFCSYASLSWKGLLAASSSPLDSKHQTYSFDSFHFP